MDINAVKQEALRQLTEERFREAVETEKQRLRQYVPWWHRIFPFVITIRRRQ